MGVETTADQGSPLRNLDSALEALDEPQATQAGTGPETAPDGDLLQTLGSRSTVAEILNSVADIEHLHLAVSSIIRGMEFSDYAFLEVRNTKVPPPLSTFPVELYRDYVESRCHDLDFLVRYGEQRSRPMFFSSIYGIAYEAPYDIDLWIINQNIYRLYQSHGFQDVYCLPMESLSGGRTMLSVAQRGISSTQLHVNAVRYRPDLLALCQRIDHLVTVRFPDQVVEYAHSDEDLSLSKAERLVLDAMANNDMTIAQLADKLHRSPITVSQQIASARRALGVKTTGAAIKKAIQLGLIEYT